MTEKSTQHGGAETVPDFVLYSTSACHLCELAEALLLPLVAQGTSIAVDDVSESDALFHRYGTRIPVLRHVATGRELDWPFDLEAAAGLLPGA